MCLRQEGTRPVVRKLFTIDEIVEPSLLKTSFEIWQASDLKDSMKV